MELTCPNSIEANDSRTLTGAGEKSFYLYLGLEKIHADFQKLIQKNRYDDVLLIMNTSGSLQHFMVHTDPEFFHEIFISLLTKALMHTEKGCLEFGYILSGRDHFHFFVKDGAGHLPQDQNEPAERYDSGPFMEGLTRTTDMVEKLGGKMWIDSLPGRATIWWFTIDVQPSHSRNYPFRELSDTCTHPDWSDKTVLVVEDVCNNYLLLETVLLPTKINLINAENCMVAVNSVKRIKDIDLVLMDLRLPVPDGYEASRRIKFHCPSLPIIAVSAYAAGKEIDRCIRAGCDSFLGKPLNTTELIRTMSGLFRKFPIDR